jgi:glycosyltransferase involved in cell wall biosynthesis
MVCGSYQGGETGLTERFTSGRRRGIVDGIDIIEFDLSYANADGFLKRTKTFLSFALVSITIALREPCDVVFATTTPLTAGIPGVFSRVFRRKPFVFEVRDLWPELPRAMGVIRNPLVLWLMSTLEWVCYRLATRLVGLSPGIVEGIARRGVDKKRIAMVSNGCDLRLFKGEHDPWRPDGVGKDDLLALYAGTHGIANGLNAVLDAAALLKQRGRSNIKILLVGQGKLKAALQHRAREEGLDNVVFHPSIEKARLAGLMAATDIGLQILDNIPAFYDGTSPNKFFDYLAASLPVLVNYPGWLAEVIALHQCGYVVPPCDPEAFAAALEQASEDREELRMMGQRARQCAVTEFSRDASADRWVDWVTGAAGFARQ